MRILHVSSMSMDANSIVTRVKLTFRSKIHEKKEKNLPTSLTLTKFYRTAGSAFIGHKSVASIFQPFLD